MTQKPTISIEATTQFLGEKFNTEITELTALRGGEWSQAYSFFHNSKKYVIRWCHSSETFEKDALASSYSSEAMLIPKVSDTGLYVDTYFAISEFAHGDFIDTLTVVELEHTLPALFGLFDALRNANISATTGFGGWGKDGCGSHRSWKEFLLDVKSDPKGNLTHGWYANLANSPIGTKIFDQLYVRLESLVDKCPEMRELIHADLLHYNVLVADAKINAVIDWQCSLYGDSLYDIAWFIYYAPWYPQFETAKLCQKAMAHYESVADNTTNLKTRLLCYQLHIGLGSIAYNAYKMDWKAAQEASEYTTKISKDFNLPG